MAFTSFPSLPPELRGQIWEEHCPQLAREPLWLQVIFDPADDAVSPAFRLRTQTAATRAVLRLSRDSRDHALRCLPNAMSLWKGRGIVRFSRHRDIVWLFPGFLTTARLSRIGAGVTGFSDNLASIAIDLKSFTWSRMTARHIFALLLSFPRLETVFMADWGPTWSRGAVAWCVSPRAHRLSSLTAEALEEQCKGELIYCWPDLARNREWAGAAIAGGRTRAGDDVLEMFLSRENDTLERMEARGDGLTGEEVRRLGAIRVWPVVVLPASELEELDDDTGTRRIELSRTMP